MHLIETYATNCGLKIDKPKIYESYQVIPVKKYITFQPHSKPAKNYDFWQEVLDVLLPILRSENISIIQIGESNEKVYGGVINYTGQTSINQAAYLIRNSLLHLGTDSFCVHIASSLDKPIVALYSNNNINNVGPYWSSKDKIITLEPERANGEKPSYSLDEIPKSINKISPEEIARSVCKLLNLDFNYEYNTVWIGEAYSNKTLELVPDNAVDLRQFGIDSIIVRMDYLHNEKMLEQQMNLGKVIIVTDKPINIELIKKYKDRIAQFVYIIEENHSPSFIKSIYNFIPKISLISFLPKDKINSLKISYMDYGLIFEKSPTPPKIILDKNIEDLFYKNGKFILARQKIYPSRDAWEKDLPIPSFTSTISKVNGVIDPKSKFWRESEHYSFLVKN